MDEKLLSGVLFAGGFDGPELSRAIVSKLGSPIMALEAEENMLLDAVGSPAAVNYLKIIASLASRRVSDRFAFGKRHTEEEIEEYLKSIFFGLAVETVYVISFDKSGRAVFSEKAGEGSVNGTNVLPRRIVEIAKRRGAASVILAHNHPSGYAIASEDDVVGSVVLRELLFAAGIKLVAHYVVAGSDCTKIDI